MLEVTQSQYQLVGSRTSNLLVTIGASPTCPPNKELAVCQFISEIYL